MKVVVWNSVISLLFKQFNETRAKKVTVVIHQPNRVFCGLVI